MDPHRTDGTDAKDRYLNTVQRQLDGLGLTVRLAPFNGLYGEGTGPHLVGIPTIAFIC